jgi:2,3-bisphosphoglycerate-independent phosphoglycerate mutase
MSPLILVILDGFGLSPITEGNPVYHAKTPFLDWAIATAPKAMLHASGSEVGLDWGEMGNSEVGHLNLGTGRIVMQDLPRINRALEDGTFFANQVMKDLAARLVKNKGTLHVIGLASTGGVHAHLNQLLAMLDFARREKLSRVALHLISDGRDTPPKTLIKDLPKINEAIKKFGVGVIASLSGRYYAMDRDQRWDRTEKAYHAIVDGKGREALTAEVALQLAETAKETDEFITPTVLVDAQGQAVAPFGEHDGVIFTNYRPDRARQLAQALTDKSLTGFARARGPVESFVSFSSYGQEASAGVDVAFFAEPSTKQLGELVASAGLSQFHIAETEKYAHVTYFFNGGLEPPFPKEERLLIPSPKVATYDLKPEMSAAGVTQGLLKRLKKSPPALLVVNYANPDMVGHTGDYAKTIRAVETVDAQLLEIRQAAAALGATLIVTADHGNAEQLIHPETHEIDKEHTTNPVPCFLIPSELQFAPVAETAEKIDQIQFAAQSPAGVLADIAPTILDFLDLEKPPEMTGASLRGLV